MKKSPSQILEIFFEGWKSMDYENMYSLTQKSWRDSHSFEHFKGMFDSFEVIEWAPLTGPIMCSEVMVDWAVSVRINALDGNGFAIGQGRIRMIHEHKPYQPQEPRKWWKRASWGINPNSVLSLFANNSKTYKTELDLEQILLQMAEQSKKEGISIEEFKQAMNIFSKIS